jgi:hypothetical protein
MHNVPALRQRRQRNVGRDNDVALVRALRDPVVRRVGPSGTTTRLISGPSGRRMYAFDTKMISSPCRSATPTASSFTGQASASMQRVVGTGGLRDGLQRLCHQGT